MPELPEVQTTVSGLQSVLPGLKITAVWSDFHKGTKHGHKENIKNLAYLKNFQKEVVGRKILSARRRGKNILINLSGEKTILAHMKMTGHFLYGKYGHLPKKDAWEALEAGSLKDPYNRFVHFVVSLSNKKHLAFSDTRKFGKIIVFETKFGDNIPDLAHLGPEPLAKDFRLKDFARAVKKRISGRIKQVLMDQSVVAGIGNIYSDEILWRAGVHPESRVGKIPTDKMKEMFRAMKLLLKTGLSLRGDSTSDYRDIYGEKGSFQLHHKAYRQTGKKCARKNCAGTIARKIIGGRSAHFCSKHQIRYT